MKDMTLLQTTLCIARIFCLEPVFFLILSIIWAHSFILAEIWTLFASCDLDECQVNDSSF